MSSNLTITYTSQIAPGSASAGVTSTAALGAAPTAGNPLGFLAALVDQLVAGGATTPPPSGSSNDTPPVTIPPELDASFVATTMFGIASAPKNEKLVPNLSRQLDTLKMQLEFGEPPDPDQLNHLNASLIALGKLLAGAAPPAAPPPAGPPAPANEASGPAVASATGGLTLSDPRISELLASLGILGGHASAPPQGSAAPAVEIAKQVAGLQERLQSMSQSLAATAPVLSGKLGTLATQLAELGGAPAFVGQLVPTATDSDIAAIGEIIRILLGEAPTEPAIPDGSDPVPDAAPAPVGDDSVPPPATPEANPAPAVPHLPSLLADVDMAVAPPSTVTVPPLLLQLSNQLSKLSAELAAAAPEFAKKLEAVATRLVSGDADTLLADLTKAIGQPDRTALNSLVRNLIEGKPLITIPVPAAPQIAADATLDIPAPIVRPAAVHNSDPDPLPPPPAPPPAPAIDGEPAPALRASAVATVAAPEPRAVAIIAKSEPKAVVELAKVDPAASVQPTPQQANQPIIPATQPRALPAAYQPVQNPINMGQVAFEMVRQVHQGTSRFTIRLDPPELGRVDVRMQVDASGAVNARLTVDRAETLDMFQRDQRSLERALAQAGLDSSRTNLEFSLRQNPFGHAPGDQRQHQHDTQSGPRFSLAATDEVTAAPAVTLYRGIASAGGVNIFA